MRSLPAEERPRERLMRYGAETLSSVELIAIILGAGTQQCPVLSIAKSLLERFHSVRAIADATLAELLLVPGIGRAKGIQLKAALQLGMRAIEPPIGRKKICSPQHVYELIRGMIEYQNREFFVALFLDAKGGVIAVETIAIGTLGEALVHPREVLYRAVHHQAASFVVAHNHPTGDSSPSKRDLEVTERLINAGECVGIPLRDHLVVGHGRYSSLRQESALFEGEMPRIGLEPTHREVPEPKSGVSTNFTTWACGPF